MTEAPSKEALLQENQQLRARLEEMEETLRAIRSGEVDALVVSRPEGEQIFTLKGALEPYRIMVENMSEGAVTLAQDGIISYCNGQFANLAKAPLDQVVGRPLHHWVAPHDRDKFGGMLARGWKEVVRDELSMQTSEGKWLPAHLSMCPLPESAGKGIAAVITDLTEVASTAEAWSRLALIVNSSDDAIISTSLDGTVETWNQAAQRLFGYTAEEATGRPIQVLIAPPERTGEIAQKLDTVRRGERMRHTETVRMRKNGSLIDVSATASPIHDAMNRVIGMSLIMRDITERKRAEEELRAASLYARSLIEVSPDPLVTISMEGKITDVNEATVKATGVGRDVLIGSDFSNYFTEPDKARAGYQEVFARGLVTDYPLVLRHASGKVMEVLYNASVYRNDKGEVAGVFAAARDITERKLTEEQLKERLKELRGFYSLAELAEREGITLDVLHQELVNALPQSWQHAEIACARIVVGDTEFHTDNFSVSEWMQAAPLTVHGSTIGKIEVGYLAPRPVQYEGPFLKEERQLLNAIAERLGRIIERKHGEEKLRATSLYARSLIEASLDPLVTISAEGKITDVNEATVKATGVARDVLIGSDFSNYFTEPDKARAGYQEVFTKGFVTDYPLALRHASGKVTDVLYNASLFRNEKGEVAGIFAAARDVTERKRAEEELRKYHDHLEELVRERTAALEAANKDLESFAYSVSHDLRVPLRAVDGFSNILLKRYPDKLDDEGKRYLNVVRDNTRRMAQLIDDILAFSRMGRLGMTMSEIDMEAMVRATFEELKPNIGERDLTMEVKPLPPCRGDQAMLHQVWVNLLGNAVKFTRPIAAARIEVGGRTEDTENLYYVKDNGVGFDMQYAFKLFGVFQRLHGVDEFEGTGIGLAIVKRIAIRHGGRVWAEGKANEGATFYFTLSQAGASSDALPNIETGGSS